MKRKFRVDDFENLGRWMDGWMGGWMDGWVDGWVDGKAGLRIAYSNQKWKYEAPTGGKRERGLHGSHDTP